MYIFLLTICVCPFIVFTFFLCTNYNNNVILSYPIPILSNPYPFPIPILPYSTLHYSTPPHPI